MFAFATINRVIPTSAKDGIFATIATEFITGFISKNNIVTATTHCIFDDSSEGNGHISGHGPDIAVLTLAQIDELIGGKPGHIQRVVAAGIPQCDDRIRILSEIEHIFSCGRIEAVGRIGFSGGGVCAINGLRSRDVVHHGRLRIFPLVIRPKMVCFTPVCVCYPIRHQ